MKSIVLIMAVLGAFAAASGPVLSEVVSVTVTGVVEFNQISDPPLGNVNSGSDATLTFLVDSDNFVNSPNFPTRGYEIDHSSCVLDFGATEIGLQDPFPVDQLPYFVIRNDDPAVDGFLLSTNIDLPEGVPVDQTGIFEQFIDNFYVTYVGDTLPSLDILDALGTYDFTGLTVFNWTIDDGPFNAMGLVFEQITIELPCPADLDGDGLVNSADLALLLGDWGFCLLCSAADINDDNTVDSADLALLLGSWGSCSQT